MTSVILVVADDATAEPLRHLLERQGDRVVTAASTERALTICRENDLGLVLVDCALPAAGGMDLVRAIRAFDPFVRIIVQVSPSGPRPGHHVLEALDVHGCHDTGDGPERLVATIGVGLSAYRMIRTLRERERAYGELVANISHELRTPLNIVAGYIGLLQEGAFGELPPATSQPLRAVESATRTLSDIVSNLLEHTRLDAGCAEVAEQPTDVGAMAHEVERLGHLLLDDKPVSLSLDVDGMPSVIVTDEVKLRTVLRNLVSNAAKFTSQGLVAVRFSTRDRWLEVSVRDTGPGIPAEDLERVFEPFRQGDGSSTREYGGIGLGLALSRKYARLLGGTLTVESVPGVGSTFTLLVPARLPAAEPPAASVVASRPALAPASRPSAAAQP